MRYLNKYTSGAQLKLSFLSLVDEYIDLFIHIYKDELKLYCLNYNQSLSLLIKPFKNTSHLNSIEALHACTQTHCYTPS